MKVTCHHPGGLRLTIGNVDPSAGEINPKHVILRQGMNDVPDAFWAHWVKENKDWPPYATGKLLVAHVEPEAVAVAEDAPKPAPKKAASKKAASAPKQTEST